MSIQQTILAFQWHQKRYLTKRTLLESEIARYILERVKPSFGKWYKPDITFSISDEAAVSIFVHSIYSVLVDEYLGPELDKRARKALERSLP